MLIGLLNLLSLSSYKAAMRAPPLCSGATMLSPMEETTKSYSGIISSFWEKIYLHKLQTNL